MIHKSNITVPTIQPKTVLLDSSTTTYSGTACYLTAGEALAAGKLCYINKTNGRLYAAKADSINTLPALYVTLTSANSGSSVLALRDGLFYTTQDLIVGPVYLSNTNSGNVIQTEPSIHGYYKQVVGCAISSNVIDFRPQPEVFINKFDYLDENLALWSPPGNSTSAPGIIGMRSLNAVGSVAARNVGTSNTLSLQKRCGWISNNGNGAMVSLRNGYLQYMMSSGTIGGFWFNCVFGISETSYVSVARMFVGFQTNTGAPTNVDPSTLRNVVGVGHNESLANLQLYTANASSCSVLDLGNGFNKSTIRNYDAVQVILYSPRLEPDVLYYDVSLLGTSTRVTGKRVIATCSLPATNTLMCFNSYRTNNTSGSTVALDLCNLAICKDY